MNMRKNPITVLGVNPGAKYLGIAVLYGPELREWRMKVTKGTWSREKYRKIVEIVWDLIERHQPDALAIKRLNPSRSSVGLDRLVQKIRELSKEERIKIYQYGIKELEAFFDPGRKSNKKNMAEIIASQYPVMYNELDQERRNKNQYYLRMFEAVGLAAACFHDLDNSKRSS